MGFTVEEIVQRMSSKAQAGKKVGVVCGGDQGVNIVSYNEEEENDLVGILREKEIRGEKPIGLIFYVPTEVDEPEVDLFPEYANDEWSRSWVEHYAADIRQTQKELRNRFGS
jgi:hypothetical protein